MYNKIPNKNKIDFNPNAVLLHTPGVNVVMLDNGIPISVPHHRFDEVQEIVQEENHIRSDESLEIYVIDDYLTSPEEIKTSLIANNETYLYEKEDESFVF